MSKRVPGLYIPPNLPTLPGVYGITCDVNDKVYVGSTITLAGHARHHKYLLSRGRDYNPPLQAAYNKYGWEYFSFSVLEVSDLVISDEDEALAAAYVAAGKEVVALACLLARREQWHMDHLGYPSTSRVFNTKPAGPSGSLGIRQPSSQKLKHSRAKGGRPLYATNEETDETTRFEQIGDACAALPFLIRAHVQDCLHGRRFSTSGYVFEWDPDFLPIVAPSHPGMQRGAIEKSRIITATDVTGKEIHFDHASAIHIAGFTLSQVYLCLAGTKTSYRGYRWSYADGLPHRATLSPGRRSGAHKHGGSRPVVGVHKVTGDVIRFEYIKQAAVHFNIDPRLISLSITNKARGKLHSAAKHFWDYEV